MKAIEALKQVEIQGMDNTMYSVEELPFYEGMSEDERRGMFYDRFGCDAHFDFLRNLIGNTYLVVWSSDVDTSEFGCSTAVGKIDGCRLEVYALE